MRNTPEHKKGFTIVETLVAITILLLAITGTMTTAQKGLQSAHYANDQMVAVFLAQEAIESIRQYRDTKTLQAYHNQGGQNPIDTEDWMPNVDCAQGCIYNKNHTPVYEVCSNNNDENNRCFVQLDSESGEYIQGGFGTPTKFTRTIYFTETRPGEVSVWVDVSWEGQIFGGTTRSVFLQTWIYDHYNRYE